MSNYTNYWHEMQKLARKRASAITEALHIEYGNRNGLYRTSDATSMYRDGMPKGNSIQFDAARSIAELIGVGKSEPIVTFIQSAYPEGYPRDPVYHGLPHAVLTAAITKRLAEIYLPHHKHEAKVAVLAALLHDAHHTQTGNDNVNIDRATQFTYQLMHALYDNSEDDFNAGSDCALITAVIAATKFVGGKFAVELPAIEAVALPADADYADVSNMVVRIVGEADLMMSATPEWPEFAAQLAYEESAVNGSTQIFDPIYFAYKQYVFAKTLVDSGRLILPENVAAMRVVIAIHGTFTNQADLDDDLDDDIDDEV